MARPSSKTPVSSAPRSPGGSAATRVSRWSSTCLMSPSEIADLERTVLALASNAEEYWTMQEIADFVGRSRRQVYRILAQAKEGPQPRRARSDHLG